jgi:hypothetical protein
MERSRIMREPYINAWKPYELSYVNVMASIGLGSKEASSRLCAVNIKLGESYRSDVTVRKMAKGAFLRAKKENRLKIAKHKIGNGITINQAAFDMGCSTTHVIKCLREYRNATNTKR